MPVARKLRRTRCVACRTWVETTVLGRCARCVSVESGQEEDWTLYATLGRAFRRHDGRRLRLLVAADEEDDVRWDVTAIETALAGESHSCLVGSRPRMTDALMLADRFAVRWLESAAGTSVATYVEPPLQRS